ncbi:MAG: hypothetical protein ACOX7D_01595 [Alphaproteobacteria bacterium]|jgi:hypothetical protein
MSKRIPNWVKNILMFGGIPAIMLLVGKNSFAQNQQVQSDSTVVTHQDSVTMNIQNSRSRKIVSNNSCIRVYSGKNNSNTNNKCIYFIIEDRKAHQK